MSKKAENAVAAAETLEDAASKIAKASNVLMKRIEELEALNEAKDKELSEVKSKLKVFEDKMRAVQQELA